MNSVHIHPSSIKHIRILKVFLRTFGAWPGEVLGEKTHPFIRMLRVETPSQTLFFLVGQFYYIFVELPALDFFEIGDLFIALFLALLTLVRTFLPNLNGYRKISRMFFLEFHLLNFKQCGGHFENMYNKVDKVSDYFTKFMMAMMLSGLILYNVSPIYNNYRNGAFSSHTSQNITFQFAIYYMFPGFYPNDHFKMATCINFYLSWLCAVSVCALDLYLSLMVIQIIAHIKVLSYNIQDISDKNTTCEKFTEVENNAILKRIKNCTDHHCVIMRFVDAMSQFFGPLLGFNYLFHLVCCCLLLLECSSMSAAAIIRYGPLTAIIFGQLIIISVTFEVVSSEVQPDSNFMTCVKRDDVQDTMNAWWVCHQLNNKEPAIVFTITALTLVKTALTSVKASDKLADTVYAVPWEKMDIRNQTSMCIILRRIQEPLKVTAAGMTDVSVRTMASILKTTFSYFIFLNSMQN